MSTMKNHRPNAKLQSEMNFRHLNVKTGQGYCCNNNKQLHVLKDFNSQNKQFHIWNSRLYAIISIGLLGFIVIVFS